MAEKLTALNLPAAGDAEEEQATTAVVVLPFAGSCSGDFLVLILHLKLACTDIAVGTVNC